MFGKSRQAYYQRIRYTYKEAVKAELLLQMIDKERQIMPRLGGRKLLVKIHPNLPPELQIGRDCFFNFLRDNQLLVRRRRNQVRTTFSNHWLHKYPNLIKEFEPKSAHQLWVSDITYIETCEGFIYLFLITDAYSRKIVGWHISETMEADNAVIALRMAISQLPRKTKHLFHHSDRGVQYCSQKYVKILEKNTVQISMTENGDPLENAVAERINGILKDEWLKDMKGMSKYNVKKQTAYIIEIYNTQRPHSSVDMLTPDQAHKKRGTLKRHWKNYWKSNERICQEPIKI